jgi:RND family efflux transporter MFP subunit
MKRIVSQVQKFASLTQVLLFAAFATVMALGELAFAQGVPTVAVAGAGANAVSAPANDPQAAFNSYMLDGVVQAVKQSTVAAQATGRIASLTVKAGDRVRAGQVVAVIDDREAQVGVTRSQAQVSQAEADLRNAKVTAERTRDLVAKGFVSKAALDAAEAQLQSASAQREQAGAGVSQAHLTQGFTRVTAPFDGWVLQTMAEAGDLAVNGKPLLTVFAPQPLRAVVQVPASRLQAVRESKQIRIVIESEGQRELTPVGRQEVPSSDPVSQTTEWRFDLPRTESQGLLPGQQVRVRFATKEPVDSRRMLVPSSAVVRRGELTAVYVVSGAGFVLRAVRLGAHTAGGMVELLAGVNPQDRVALDPNRAAFAGAVPAKAAP